MVFRKYKLIDGLLVVLRNHYMIDYISYKVVITNAAMLCLFHFCNSSKLIFDICSKWLFFTTHNGPLKPI
jgi:hypothetical protein